jgi:hypothetical protein
MWKTKALLIATVLAFALLSFNVGSVSAIVIIPPETHLGFQNGAYMNFSASATFSTVHMEGYANYSWFGWWFFDGVGVWSNVNVTFVTAMSSVDWVNYTIGSGSGSQRVYGFGSPTLVLIDGSVATTGWSYGGGITFVSGATANASIYFGSVSLYDSLGVDTQTLGGVSLGFDVTVNGTSFGTPYAGLVLNESFVTIVAPSLVTTSSYRYDFLNWSDASTSNTLATTVYSNLTAIAYYSSTTLVVPPSNETTFIIPSGATALTWFLRGDVHTGNVAGYFLGPDETHLPTSDSVYTSGDVSVSYGVRVYVRIADGSLYDLTGNTTELLVTRILDGEGLAVGYWNCTGYGDVVDGVVVKVYQRFGVGDWSLRSTFASDFGNLMKLPVATWTFSLYTNRTDPYDNTWSSLSWGSSAYNSSVGLYFNSPSATDIQMFHLMQGDFVGFIMAPFIVAGMNFCYLMIVLILGITLYIRQESVVPMAIIFLLFGGAGGVILNLLPTATWQLAYLFFAFAIAILLMKVVKGKDYGE